MTHLKTVCMHVEKVTYDSHSPLKRSLKGQILYSLERAGRRGDEVMQAWTWLQGKRSSSEMRKKCALLLSKILNSPELLLGVVWNSIRPVLCSAEEGREGKLSGSIRCWQYVQQGRTFALDIGGDICFPTMEVNGAPKQPGYKLSSKYLPLCSAEQRNSYRFGTTWGRVNDRILIFGWTIPLIAHHFILILIELDPGWFWKNTLLLL